MNRPDTASDELPPFAPDWAFFLDVDGTLLELAEHPLQVEVRPELVAVLHDLYAVSAGAVALVSGRSLADLDRILLPEHLPASGQHGLERRDGRGAVHRAALDAGALDGARAELEAFRAAHPGTLVEDKGGVLALHYRAAPALEAPARALATRLARALGPAFKAQHGKMVVEIKAAGHDKGTAIDEFLAEPPFRERTAVFIGDDVTDEDGFRRVNALGGVTVKVGAGPTVARYRLADPYAVLDFLAAYVRAQRTGAHAQPG